MIYLIYIVILHFFDQLLFVIFQRLYHNFDERLFHLHTLSLNSFEHMHDLDQPLVCTI